jgi:hypothetical protein
MRRVLPEDMFAASGQATLRGLRDWILSREVTELEMTEKQFWVFASLQPAAEKPWASFMGRSIRVPDMPESVQKQLGVFDAARVGVI